MKMLAQVKVGLLAGVMALALAVAWPASIVKTKEEKIKFADCPAAVQKTIKDNAASGAILEVEKETKKDGTVVYEAEVKKADGATVEITVAEDGKLIKIEDEDDEDDDDDDDDTNR